MMKSIAQLRAEGYSKSDLYAYAHDPRPAAHERPALLTKGGGKYLFDTEKLEKYISKYVRR